MSNRAGRLWRQLAAVVAAAVGDAEWRWYDRNGRKGWGLRGGTCSYTGPLSGSIHGQAIMATMPAP